MEPCRDRASSTQTRDSAIGGVHMGFGRRCTRDFRSVVVSESSIERLNDRRFGHQYQLRSCSGLPPLPEVRGPFFGCIRPSTRRAAVNLEQMRRSSNSSCSRAHSVLATRVRRGGHTVSTMSCIWIELADARTHIVLIELMRPAIMERKILASASRTCKV
jgi:hypothetical protein